MPDHEGAKAQRFEERNVFRAAVLIGFLLIASAPSMAQRGTERVAVHSLAEPEYVQRKAGDAGDNPETYVFMKGRFFGGGTRDKSIEELPFRSVMLALARELTRQNYFPTQDKSAADLLIVVHWGTTLRSTQIEDDWDALENLREQLGPSDPMFLLAKDNYETSTQRQIAYMARLLGYQEAMEKERERPALLGPSDRERSMKEQLAQQRYFVILMAWDYQVLRQENKRVLLWSTRFSMPTPGKNFVEALPAMARVAGDHFGQDLRDVEIERTHLGEGDVEFEDLEIIEFIPHAEGSED